MQYVIDPSIMCTVASDALTQVGGVLPGSDQRRPCRRSPEAQL